MFIRKSNNASTNGVPLALTFSKAPPNMKEIVNPLNANITKWSNTLKHFVGKLATNCLSLFDHFVGLALKALINVGIYFKLTLISPKKNLS